MAFSSSTVDRLRLLIWEVLAVEIPDADTDLIDSGLLDSLALVTMIAEIEEEFRVELPLEDLDVDRFRSVDRIAAFLGEAYPAVR